MQQRSRGGSVVEDKRSKVWNFFWWESGKRRSKKIGTKAEFPTKSIAWKAAKPLRDAVENQTPVVPEPVAPATVPTVSTVAEQYRIERMPKRKDTRRSYEVWLSNYIVPKWGECSISDVQPRPVQLWLESLALSPKSRADIRGLLRVLLDYAMWAGHMSIGRNPMELVRVHGATKRTAPTPEFESGRVPEVSCRAVGTVQNNCANFGLLRTPHFGGTRLAMG